MVAKHGRAPCIEHSCAHGKLASKIASLDFFSGKLGRLWHFGGLHLSIFANSSAEVEAPIRIAHIRLDSKHNQCQNRYAWKFQACFSEEFQKFLKTEGMREFFSGNCEGFWFWFFEFLICRGEFYKIAELYNLDCKIHTHKKSLNPEVTTLLSLCFHAVSIHTPPPDL